MIKVLKSTVGFPWGMYADEHKLHWLGDYTLIYTSRLAFFTDDAKLFVKLTKLFPHYHTHPRKQDEVER